VPGQARVLASKDQAVPGRQILKLPNGHQGVDQTSRHYAGALARNRKIWRKIHSISIGPGSRKYSAALGARAPCATVSDAL
jgi:hypothetical protein